MWCLVCVGRLGVVTGLSMIFDQIGARIRSSRAKKCDIGEKFVHPSRVVASAHSSDQQPILTCSLNFG